MIRSTKVVDGWTDRIQRKMGRRVHWWAAALHGLRNRRHHLMCTEAGPSKPRAFQTSAPDWPQGRRHVGPPRVRQALCPYDGSGPHDTGSIR